jgi:hypothetical protein
MASTRKRGLFAAPLVAYPHTSVCCRGARRPGVAQALTQKPLFLTIFLIGLALNGLCRSQRFCLWTGGYYERL